jgi:hypothetical protein
MGIPTGPLGELAEQIGKAIIRDNAIDRRIKKSKKTEYQKESKEHPSMSPNEVAQIVHDHDHGFYAHSISGKTDCFYKNVGNTTGKKRI